MFSTSYLTFYQYISIGE